MRRATVPRRRRYLEYNDISGTFPLAFCDVPDCSAESGNNLDGPCDTSCCDFETCSTGAPTADPSAMPTGAPTVTPTATPSDAPTATPSDAPIPLAELCAAAGFDVECTAKPSDAPTPKPTPEPTAKPSDAPSAKPSDAPTDKPSDAPSAKPSDAPIPLAELCAAAGFDVEGTAKPSDAPTAKPSDAPSAKPASPTTAPTNLSQDAGEFGQGDGSFTEPDACSGLAKKTCKKTAGCVYKKKTCISCSELSKGKCKKTAGCAYKKKTCSTSGGDACSGLVADTACKYIPKKRKCKRAGCRWNKKKWKCLAKRVKD